MGAFKLRRFLHPGSPPPPTNLIADNAALFAMLNAGVGASGGKTYTLAANTDFGGCGIYNYDFSANPITVVGQAGSVFQWIEFAAVKGVTWRDFNVYGQLQSGYAVEIEAACPGLNLLQVTYNSGAAEGTQSGNGILCLQASGPVVIAGHRNAAIPDVAGRGNAVNISQSSGITLKDMTIANFNVDGILVAGSDHITVDGNLVHDANYGAGDHPDGIQFFGSGGVPCTNCVVTNNGLIQLPGEQQMQGIFHEDTETTLIQNNWIYGGTPTSIGNARGSSFTIDNNFCQGIDDGAGGALGTGGNIVTRGGAVDTTVTNNTAYSISNHTADGVNPGYVPATLPGTNTVTATATPWGTYTALDAWLSANPTARARPA